MMKAGNFLNRFYNFDKNTNFSTSTYIFLKFLDFQFSIRLKFTAYIKHYQTVSFSSVAPKLSIICFTIHNTGFLAITTCLLHNSLAVFLSAEFEILENSLTNVLENENVEEHFKYLIKQHQKLLGYSKNPQVSPTKFYKFGKILGDYEKSFTNS